MILFIPLKGSWAQNIFSMFAFIKKIKIEYNFNLSFVNFRKKMTTEHRLSFLIIHFSLFQFRKTMNIKFNLISLPHPPPPQKKKMKNEHAVSLFIFNFQKKRDEPNAGQVISFKQWSFVSFPVVDVILNSRTRDFNTAPTDAKSMKSFAPMETSRSPPSIKVCSLYS